MLNTNEPETYLSYKPRCEFITQNVVKNNEPETYFLSHKPRFKSVIQIMAEYNEPETHLSHKPCYKFITQIVMKNNEP